jgi:protein-tyrosine phosphatase
MTNIKPLENIKKILVVCTGNICRSPMGEGVLRYRLNQAGLSHIHVHSAGTSGWDNHKPTSEAIQACSEIGVDISSLRSTPISKRIIQASDLIMAMEKYHIREMKKYFDAPSKKLFLLGNFHADTPGIEIKDPYGMPLSYYRSILKTICQCADGLIDSQ